MRANLALCLAIVVWLLGCATGQEGGGVNKELAVGYASVTQLRDKAFVLLGEKKISNQEAQEVQREADQAKAELDHAKAMQTVEPAAAEMRLNSALKKIKAYGEKLKAKEKEKP